MNFIQLLKGQIVFIVFFLIFIPQHLFSQKFNHEQTGSEKKIKGWQPGYIVLKDSNKFESGFIKIRTAKFSEVVSVKFEKQKKGRDTLLKVENYNHSPFNDTIQLFGFRDKNYKWVSYTDSSQDQPIYITGWAEVIEQGKIELYIAVCDTNNGFNSTRFFDRFKIVGAFKIRRVNSTAKPCMCLKKENKYVVFKTDNDAILSGEHSFDSILSEKSKIRLLELISDNINVCEKWEFKKIKFSDIPIIIYEYNNPDCNFNRILKGEIVQKDVKSKKDKTKFKSKIVQQDIKPEKTTKAPIEQKHNKNLVLPHKGIQCSLYFGNTWSTIQAKLNGGNYSYTNLYFFSYYGINLGYAQNNWAAGLTYGINTNIVNPPNIGDTLYNKIGYLQNELLGVYLKRYLPRRNIFVSAEIGLGRFYLFDKNLNLYSFTKGGFSWDLKAGKEFFIGKRKKWGIGAYVNLLGIKCSDVYPHAQNTFSNYALGFGLITSFN